MGLAFATPPSVVNKQGSASSSSKRAGTHPSGQGTHVVRMKRYLPRIKSTRQSMTLYASWTRFSKGGRNILSRPEFQRAFSVKVRKKKRRYRMKSFAAFLPSRAVSMGQIWKIKPASFLFLLRQFHSFPSVYLHHNNEDSNGAYGAVRAVSKRYIEIALRLHAEFELLRGRVYYTPACFLGRMILDRKHHTVVSFRLYVPNRTLNVDINADRMIDIVHVSRMELVGGKRRMLRKFRWSKSLSEARIQERIKQKHYPYTQAKWVSWQKAVALAKKYQKPIHMIVLFGRLDDESC